MVHKLRNSCCTELSAELGTLPLSLSITYSWYHHLPVLLHVLCQRLVSYQLIISVAQHSQEALEYGIPGLLEYRRHCIGPPQVGIWYVCEYQGKC